MNDIATRQGNADPLPPTPSALPTAARLLLLGAVLLGASGVALGAYQAHGLARWLERQIPSNRPAPSDPATTPAPANLTETTASPANSPANSSSNPTPVSRRLANAETAVRYQLVHAAAMLGLAALSLQIRTPAVALSGALMVLGLGGFSGGLWQIVITGRPWHWAIVPAGGLLLIVAWLTLTATIFSRSQPATRS